MEMWRYGVYDADGNLVHDSGELAVDDTGSGCHNVTIPFEIPEAVPDGGFILLCDGRGNWWPFAFPKCAPHPAQEQQT